MYYVYFHINPSNKEIFYVGKGKDRRAYSKYNRNDDWKNIVKENGFEVKIVETNLSESEAFKMEIFYIKEIGVDKLTNHTLGGQGCSPTEKTRNKISKSLIGHKLSDETKEKIKNTLTGKKQSEETKQKRRGKTPWNKGLKTPDEIKLKISNSVKKAMDNLPNETKEKIKQTQFKKITTPTNEYTFL